MDTRWFKGVPQDKHEQHKQKILQYAQAYEDLAKILETFIEDKAPDYKNPSWAYEQADRNGRNHAYRTVLNLIKLTKD